jgi:hypothetical protein
VTTEPLPILEFGQTSKRFLTSRLMTKDGPVLTLGSAHRSFHAGL